MQEIPAQEQEIEEDEASTPAEDPNEVHIRVPVTFAVALVTLIIGMALGYVGRPLVTPDPTPKVQTVMVQVTAPPAPTTPAPTAPVVSSSAATATATGRQAVIDRLISQTRHFKGDPNAPITILDFSDFQ